MSNIPFHNTRMGHTFFEHTMPELVRQITRLNDILGRLLDQDNERRDAIEDHNAEDEQ